ncbi:MAG: NAD-dependent epimerase/dehydratase family protein [Vicinamibacteria bacterium]|nr:NAD-dependent epimerase/dehydratase family protein [Vicinamibacteria bacterium]
MRVLVTGGGGFLGRAVALRLVGLGHDVTSAARGDYPELRALGVRTVRLDLGDSAAVRAAATGMDAIVHAAAKAGVWGPREEYERANVDGTRHVVEACRAAGVPRLVHTSSPSVVFDGRDHENAGNDLLYPARHEAVYPETKAAAERLVLGANGRELATISLRPHLIWGPRDPHLLPRLFERARRGLLRIVGSGRNRVSITYVDNAAEAHVAALLSLAPGAAWAGRAYFVNDAEPVVLWQWLNGLLARLGLPQATRRVPLGVARAAGAILETTWRALRLAGEPPLTRFVAAQLAASHWYDLAPARAAFGYAPPVDGEEALRRTVEWWGPRVRGPGGE